MEELTRLSWKGLNCICNFHIGFPLVKFDESINFTDSLWLGLIIWWVPQRILLCLGFYLISAEIFSLNRDSYMPTLPISAEDSWFWVSKRSFEIFHLSLDFSKFFKKSNFFFTQIFTFCVLTVKIYVAQVNKISSISKVLEGITLLSDLLTILTWQKPVVAHHQARRNISYKYTYYLICKQFNFKYLYSFY